MAQRILIVDDSSTVRVRLSRILTDAGYETVAAGDGREALRLAAEVRPQLVILDVQMPEIDGYGVCEELKTSTAGDHDVPVIFLTSLESQALDLLGEAMGAYLKKPVTPQVLLDTVSRCVEPPCHYTAS